MPQHNTPILEFEALGTHWWIELRDQSEPADIQAVILARVAEFQDTYSRFLPTSVLGMLNSKMYVNRPSIELLSMLKFAHDMYDVSDGIFNISVGGTLSNLGYGYNQDTGRLDENLWDNVSMNSDQVRIPGGVELDFGGFGKGWLIDDLGRLLQAEGCKQFVINGGGDVLVSSVIPLEFALEHPTDSSKKIGSTRISHGALAVSSSVKRVWKNNDTQYHHIIDPRIDVPSNSPVISTYVKADSALIADTMATILLIAPELNDKLTQRFGLHTILLDKRSLKG